MATLSASDSAPLQLFASIGKVSSARIVTASKYALTVEGWCKFNHNNEPFGFDTFAFTTLQLNGVFSYSGSGSKKSLSKGSIYGATFDFEGAGANTISGIEYKVKKKLKAKSLLGIGSSLDWSKSSNKIEGSFLSDWIVGGDRDDIIIGNGGGDWIYGEGGDDILNGGGGILGDSYAYLDGGPGADTFVINAYDDTGKTIIQDYTKGEDVLDLSGLDGSLLTRVLDGAYVGVKDLYLYDGIVDNDSLVAILRGATSL